jgi:hypothetical protein
VSNGSLPASSYYWPREIFLVEDNIQGDTDGDNHPNITAMGYFSKSAILGCTINKATEHSLRVWQAYKLFIAHNAIGGEHYAPAPPGIRAAVKIHSGGTGAYNDNIGVSGLELKSSYVVLADNTIGTASYQGSWLMGCAPQNADLGYVEAFEDLILERNGFHNGPYTDQHFHIVAKGVTTRGNFDIGGGPLLYDMVTAAEWAACHQATPSRCDPGMLPYLGPYYGQAM